MKITHILLALLAFGFLGQEAFSSDINESLGFAIMPDPHGRSHFLYVQTNGHPDYTTVALHIGTLANANDLKNPFASPGPVEMNIGTLRFLPGTNQNGPATTTTANPQSTETNPQMNQTR